MGGAGVVVSTSRVADAAGKAELYARYNAKAVDMEAASVAEVARQNGIRFMALKAISDDAHTTLPEMAGFVDAAGNFRVGGFFLHVLLRPALWGAVRRLAQNTALASRALQEQLSAHQQSGEFQRLARENTSIDPKKF